MCRRRRAVIPSASRCLGCGMLACEKDWRQDSAWSGIPRSSPISPSETGTSGHHFRMFCKSKSMGTGENESSFRCFPVVLRQTVIFKKVTAPPTVGRLRRAGLGRSSPELLGRSFFTSVALSFVSNILQIPFSILNCNSHLSIISKSQYNTLIVT